jgi:hypothetical protein
MGLRNGATAAGDVDTGRSGEAETDVPEEDHDDDGNNYSDFSTSDIPKSLLTALTNEALARRSSFMSQQQSVVEASLDEYDKGIQA